MCSVQPIGWLLLPVRGARQKLAACSPRVPGGLAILRQVAVQLARQASGWRNPFPVVFQVVLRNIHFAMGVSCFPAEPDREAGDSPCCVVGQFYTYHFLSESLFCLHLHVGTIFHFCKMWLCFFSAFCSSLTVEPISLKSISEISLVAAPKREIVSSVLKLIIS